MLKIKRLLFENRGTKQIIVKNFSWLALSQIISKGVGFIASIYLARVLVAEGLGKLGFAGAILSYFGLIESLGLETFGIREIARNAKEVYKKYVNNILTIKLVTSIISFGLLLIFIYFIPQSLEIKKLILFSGFALLVSAFALDWFFRGIEKMEWVAFSQIFYSFCYLGLIFLIIKSPEQLLKIPLISISVSIITTCILLFVFTKKFGPIKLNFDFSLWKKILKQSLPMGFSVIMITIYYNFDHIMLGFMKNMEVVGWYEVAYKIILLIICIQSLINQSIFPALSRLWSSKQIEKLKKFVNTGMSYMFLLSLIIIIFSLCIGRYIITLIYGPGFQNSIIIFMLLAFTAFLVYNETITAPLLLASNKQSQYLVGVGVGAIVNLILNALLIPKFSYYGAAVATIIAEIFVFSFLFYFSLKIVKIDFKKVWLYNLISFFIPLPIMILNLNVINKFSVFIILFLLLNLFFRFKTKDPIVIKLKQKIWGPKI